jgi:hypothetical protein
MIDQLRSLGIEKGKPFQPDDATRALLASAAQDAHAWFEARYDAGLTPFFSSTSHWTYPAPLDLVKAMQDGFSDADAYPTDSRGLAYSYAFIGIRRLGAGQFYAISIHDKGGNSFDGSQIYRLTVPPNVPVEQYWSVTALRPRNACADQEHAARQPLVANSMERNADGSIDVYFGPKSPTGKEANWVPTDPARKFELMARFYGPKKEFFDKLWKLPDVEKVN